MQVAVNGNQYQGFGKNKKMAKSGAAIQALRHEHGIVLTSPSQEVVPSNASEGEMHIQISGVSLFMHLVEFSPNFRQSKSTYLFTASVDRV